MCTLSYLLTAQGYELFFNRDEQHSRPVALKPKMETQAQAIYPIDPQGQGTWLAVNKNGLSLALLNFYQACDNTTVQAFVSRGQLIPQLMKKLNQASNANKNSTTESLLLLTDLTVYQPFQLAIFPRNLTATTNKVLFFQWNGDKLVLTNKEQPFTSSGVKFEYVEQRRKDKFNQLVCPKNANREQFKAFHLSQETQGEYSVNMSRFDAKTVSISHICVDKSKISQQISFDYFDNINKQHYRTLI
jgi:transport and Golgi organization protein 2